MVHKIKHIFIVLVLLCPVYQRMGEKYPIENMNKGQTIDLTKILHRKLKIEHHEPYLNIVVD